METRTYTFSGRKNQWGEYAVLCRVNGKRYEDGDYRTEDKQDAIATMAAMVAHEAKRNEDNFWYDVENAIEFSPLVRSILDACR